MSKGLEIIESWQRDEHSTDSSRRNVAIRLRSLYELLAGQLFCQYEPTKITSPRITRDFLYRLERWLEGFQSDDDRWAAFRSIEYLFFAGQDEFAELYRCAHDHVLTKWLVEVEDLDIFSPAIDDHLRDALDACWPCPVTDSLRINGFLHLTGMKGQDLRPDWMSLRKLGSTEKIKVYVKENKIKYLVLLEDFVGSGGQLSRTLKFAASTFDGPILVVPLIICAPGHRQIELDLHKIGRRDIRYEPMLVLDDTCLVGKAPNAGEPKLFEALRKALGVSYKRMRANLNGEEFGWEYVGSLAVMYSNCPNNTPPMFYYNSSRAWKPIFPRASRN